MVTVEYAMATAADAAGDRPRSKSVQKRKRTAHREQPVLVSGKNQLNLICGRNHDVGKHRFEAALFVLVVQHHDGSDPQRMPAGTARRHFTLQIL
jgi:hypothetical protein